MTVWYDGLTRPMDVAGGFVVQTSASEALTLGKDFIAYDDPTDSYERHNFQKYVAAIFPEGGVKTRFVPDRNHLKQGIYGNAVGVKRGMKTGEKFSYWFGASWCVVNGSYRTKFIKGYGWNDSLEGCDYMSYPFVL